MTDLKSSLRLISQKSKEQERLRSPAVNYFGPEKGPFLCGNCEYFKRDGESDDGYCRNEQVQAHVELAGCCNLFEQIEDKEEAEGEEEE